MSARRAVSLAASGAAAVVVAGCGGGGSSATSSARASSGSPSRAATNLRLTADSAGRLAFDRTTLQATAGKVTIALRNPAPLSHNIAIDGVPQQGDVVGQGGTSTVTATLKPGTYTFSCAVPGHRQAGMEGTLTVG